MDRGVWWTTHSSDRSGKSVEKTRQARSWIGQDVKIAIWHGEFEARTHAAETFEAEEDLRFPAEVA
jgi:hypothetical protein